MLIREDGEIVGSVSGGCVEAAVIEAAFEVIVTEEAKRLDFGIADSLAWEVGLSCGGEISILITKISDKALAPNLLTVISELNVARSPVGLRISVNTGCATLAELVPSISHLADDIFWFSLSPRPSLIIIGATHIAQHLTPIAVQNGFEVCVIDPRQIFVSAERFSGVKVIKEWPSEVLPKLSLDS